MSIHGISVREQLAEVDLLLVKERRSYGTRNEALRAIAADLRARLDGAPTVAATELQMRINIVKQSKTVLGYSEGTLIALAQEFIGRWPCVKLALERFEDEVSR